MDTRSKDSNYFIYFAVFSVNLITFTTGGCWTWTSPILPKLSSPDPNINPLPRPITTFEESWIAAIMNLGAVIGPLAGGVCAEKFGKKRTLLIMGVPMVTSHLLCAFAKNVHLFLVARFIIGIGAGTVFGVLPGFVGDIVEDKNRGTLGSVLGVTNCIGILFMYLVGPFLSIRMFSLINVIPMILFYAIFGYCIPESPLDLVRFGKPEAAERSLMKFKNKTSSQIQKQLSFIIDSYEALEDQNNSFLNLFNDKALIKGLIISNGLMFFQQFSGISAVLAYMQSIFAMTGSSIPSAYSAMLIGFIQLLSNIASAQLVDRAGRKMLLLISYIFSTLSLITLGAYFFLKYSGKNVDEIYWLPLASLVIYIIAFNMGLANMPWVLSAEIFSPNTKSLATTITSFSTFFFSFVITMGFPYISAALGIAGSFWIFAAILAAGFAFTVVVVPETKGKSNLEIQNILEGIQK